MGVVSSVWVGEMSSVWVGVVSSVWRGVEWSVWRGGCFFQLLQRYQITFPEELGVLLAKTCFCSLNLERERTNQLFDNNIY